MQSQRIAMAKKPAWYYRQTGVLPLLDSGHGTKIVLITSKRQKQWILPKGVIEPNMSPDGSALKEALEEAGITGSIDDHQPVGFYKFYKWQGECTVRIYRMTVHEVLDNWPEKQHRQRAIVGPHEALTLISNPALRDIVRRQFAVKAHE